MPNTLPLLPVLQTIPSLSSITTPSSTFSMSLNYSEQVLVDSSTKTILQGLNATTNITPLAVENISLSNPITDTNQSLNEVIQLTTTSLVSSEKLPKDEKFEENVTPEEDTSGKRRKTEK